jgi:hypothetical protein
MSELDYITEHLFFIIAFYKYTFQGDKYGKCGDQCKTICQPLCRDFFVSVGGSDCTCLDIHCDEHASCKDSTCHCTQGYRGNRTFCCLQAAPHREQAFIDILRNITDINLFPKWIDPTRIRFLLAGQFGSRQC